MLSYLQILPQTIAPAISWLPIVGVAILVILLAYLGIAMAAALFGGDEASCRRAHAIFRDLLNALTRRQR